ncbi:PREDICTED: uncharacterized protein LOC109244304 [Nicotiana attenuata]|uniref:uncharacterized protein LOC109244304 n=1 Tax=Nicotiana attenuata TaxID=49451 RepID=UPI000904E406|nr:PREDICTED: uncharacterized protein LOC109244304 [Nicotiana attenuata]
MPFPEKWNTKPVARDPNAVPRLKEWVEGIVAQNPYFKRAWRELSKGRWEARSQGLSKDVAMRPLSGDEDCHAESPAPRRGEEKKRERAPSSPNSEKKKTRRRLVRKSKNSTSARAPSSDSLHRLRNESEDEEEALNW